MTARKVYTRLQGNRHYRALSKPIGFITTRYHLTAKMVPVVMNAELKDMQAARKAYQSVETDLDPQSFTNQPDPDLWHARAS